MNRLTCVIVHPDANALPDLCRAAEEAELFVKGTASDAQALMLLLRTEQPHVLLLHALTPAFDPEALAALPLMRRPALIYLVPARFPARQAAELRPALSTHPTAGELRAAVENALPLPVSDELLLRAEALAARMGLPDRPARRLLACAVGMAYNDRAALSALSRDILPVLARRYDTTPRRASEAMRRLIDRAWTTGDIEAQYAFFGNTIDEKRGKPTLVAFLATAAELMRLGRDQ